MTAVLEPRFIEADSLRNLALNASIFAILAVGQTLVIITRNVDLSMGSVLGLSAFLAGDLLSEPSRAWRSRGLRARHGPRRGLRAVQRILVTWGQVPALVVTLGTLYAFRGLAFLWTNGRQVNAETLPDPFLNLGSDSIAGIPILVLIALVIVLVVGQWLRDYRPGRELYAIGSNPEGAGWPACARSAACWPRSCCRARSPDWAACSSPRASARSTRPPASATS